MNLYNKVPRTSNFSLAGSACGQCVTHCIRQITALRRSTPSICVNFSLSLCYTAPSNMSFRGGAKPRRGNLPVQCLFLRYFSIDCTRRLPRRMASSRHAPRNDKLDTFCISSVSSININLNINQTSKKLLIVDITPSSTLDRERNSPALS